MLHLIRLLSLWASGLHAVLSSHSSPFGIVKRSRVYVARVSKSVEPVEPGIPLAERSRIYRPVRDTNNRIP